MTIHCAFCVCLKSKIGGSIEVFQNEILAAWQKYLNVEVILISEFMNPEI